MIEVKQIINPLFSSNTFIISEAKSSWVWLIDIGNFEKVMASLPKEAFVKGVFITHAHFDHIQGINALTEVFPDCVVYVSAFAEKGLYSEKMNMSFYHEYPIVFKGTKTQILREADRIELFDGLFLEAMETPGHNEGCLTYRVGNYLFTGDSYIPNVKVVTKLKGGDKEANKNSLIKIKENIFPETIVCPGHGEMSQPSQWK